MLPAERKWRQKFGEQAFKNILEHIALIYDVGVGHPAQQTRGNLPQINARGNSADWVNGKFYSRLKYRFYFSIEKFQPNFFFKIAFF